MAIMLITACPIAGFHQRDQAVLVSPFDTYTPINMYCRIGKNTDKTYIQISGYGAELLALDSLEAA